MPNNVDLVLQVSGIESNAHASDNVASKAIDGSLVFPNCWIANTASADNTIDDRGANEDVALTIDLGGMQLVKTLRIIWNYPSVRQYNYTVWTSLDGISYIQVGGAMQSTYSETVGIWEEFDVGAVQANFVQIRSTGNTDAVVEKQGWIVINEIEVVGDQLVFPPNGYNIQIVGEGIEQNHPIFGEVGDNTRTVTPGPVLEPGAYTYTVSGPSVTSGSGGFAISGVTTEERCITHVQNVVPGESVTLNLADFNDGLGGIPQRFVIAQQPAIGSVVVVNDGQSLEATLPLDATGKSNAKVNVEYEIDG